jgi:hypothetical protein
MKMTKLRQHLTDKNGDEILKISQIEQLLKHKKSSCMSKQRLPLLPVLCDYHLELLSAPPGSNPL